MAAWSGFRCACATCGQDDGVRSWGRVELGWAWSGSPFGSVDVDRSRLVFSNGLGYQWIVFRTTVRHLELRKVRLPIGSRARVVVVFEPDGINSTHRFAPRRRRGLER